MWQQGQGCPFKEPVSTNSIHPPSRTLLWIPPCCSQLCPCLCSCTGSCFSPGLILPIPPCLHPRDWAHSMSDGLGSSPTLPSLAQGRVLWAKVPSPSFSEEHRTQPALNKQSQCCLSHFPFNLSVLNSWLAQWDGRMRADGSSHSYCCRLSAGSGEYFYMALLLIYVPLVYSPGREISTGCKSDFFFSFIFFAETLARNSFKCKSEHNSAAGMGSMANHVASGFISL